MGMMMMMMIGIRRNGRLTTRLSWQRRCCPRRKERRYRPIIFFLEQARTIIITPTRTLLIILSSPFGGMESITAGGRAVVHVFIRRMIGGGGGESSRWCRCCHISTCESTFAPPVWMGELNWWNHFHAYLILLISEGFQQDWSIWLVQVCAVIRLVSIVWLTECRPSSWAISSVRIFGVALCTFLGTIFLGISPRFGFGKTKTKREGGTHLLEAVYNESSQFLHHCFIAQLLYNATTHFMQWIASILFYLQAQWCQVPSKKYMTSLDTNYIVCRFHQWKIRSNPPSPLFLVSESQRNYSPHLLTHSLTQYQFCFVAITILPIELSRKIIAIVYK